MADSNTPNLNFVQPEVGSSKGSWGTKLNSNWELLDTILGGSGTTGTFLRRAGGTMTGPIILPTSNPTTDNQASRKAYVDQQIATRLTQAASDSRYLRLAGGTLAGQVATSLDPTAATHLARKNYVDTQVNTRLSQSMADSLYLRLSGGSITGQVATNLDPAINTHLARKAYVDSQISTRLTQAAGDARYVNISATTSWGRSFINEANSADARGTLAVPPTSRRVIPGVGLTLTSGTDNLGSDVNLRLGNPSSITADSENTVTSSSHTHAISEATVGVLMSRLGRDQIGAHRFLARPSNGADVNPGALIAGSQLRSAGISYNGSFTQLNWGSDTLPGTWMLLGVLQPPNSSSTTASEFKRVS